MEPTISTAELIRHLGASAKEIASLRLLFGQDDDFDRANAALALQRLQQHTQMVESDQPALATMKIAGAGSWMALLSTHPPLEARIAALRAAR